MEIVIVWSWLSFIVGAVSAVLTVFVLALIVSFRQMRKQRRENEKAFSIWTNSGL